MVFSAIIKYVAHHNNGKHEELGDTHCGRTTFHWGERTYIIGIINASPDSFAGDGLGNNIDAAVARARHMAAEGADIIDVGGESTRPGSTPISIDEELHRVIPVLERLTEEIPLPLSIDSYKLAVAQQALDAGACIINDVWGLKQEPRLAKLAAERKVPLILMSNQRDVSPQHNVTFPDIISVVISNLQQSMEQALAAGVPGRILSLTLASASARRRSKIWRLCSDWKNSEYYIGLSF